MRWENLPSGSDTDTWLVCDVVPSWNIYSSRSSKIITISSSVVVIIVGN